MKLRTHSLVFLVLLISGGSFLAGQDQDAPSPDELALGKKLYDTHCRTCHMPKGKSRIKKLNLSDGVWRHGGQLEDIEKTVSEGIEASQMQPFKNRMKPEEITVIAKYVLTFVKVPRAGSK